MDSLTMTKRGQNTSLIRKSEDFFIVQARVSIFCDLLGAWKLATNVKFQLKISKMLPGIRKNTETCGANATRCHIFNFLINMNIHILCKSIMVCLIIVK